jgi:hypothetical protein
MIHRERRDCCDPSLVPIRHLVVTSHIHPPKDLKMATLAFVGWRQQIIGSLYLVFTSDQSSIADHEKAVIRALIYLKALDTDRNHGLSGPGRT